MVYFETYTLLSCSLKLGRVKDLQTHLLTDCHKCYGQYRTEESFLDNIINKRKSYMACLAYHANSRKRINHVSVPIILGTYLDFLIRGRDALLKTRAQWGQVIIRGTCKMYFSFSTFDALSMHVRKSQGNLSIEWFFYVDGEGVALCYQDHVVRVTYKRETVTNLEDSGLWIDLINRANPFGGVAGEADDYLTMFDTMLTYPYDMNNLQNRQFLTCGTIINKVIEHNLIKKQKKKSSGNDKLSEIFENAKFFNILSKKNTYENDMSNKNYSQNYDNPLSDGRSNKTSHFLPTVTRASNEAFRNSSALVYPRDAVNYLCTVNTKDLKAAGEQNVLADFVIMSEMSDPQAVYGYMRKLHEPKTGQHSVILNGFLVNIRCTWTFETLLDVKRSECCKHVTTKYYWPYVYVFTKDSIPLKFSDTYGVFFSPAETTEYGIRYEKGSQFSITANVLDKWALIKNPPAKTTVTINNIKGSVANVTSTFHKKIMCASRGLTCYIEIDEPLRQKIQDSSTLSTGNAPNLEHFALITRTFDCTEPTIPSIDEPSAYRALLGMYDMRKLRYTSTHSPSTPTFTYQPNGSALDTVTQYRDVIFNDATKTPQAPWNLRAWVMFGNVRGSCIEDGVVFDRKFVQSVPPVMYNACIHVTFKLQKTTKYSRFVAVDIGSSDTLIGCVITNTEVHVKNSKHCVILVTKIGNHFYHLIHFKPKHQYSNLSVSNVLDGNKTLTVFIHGTHAGRFGVGTKIANAYGQKNVCASVEDLSRFWGITRDGRKVHAQVVFSDVSLIGRIPVGQIRSMLASPDCALGPNMELLAPQDLVIHTIHPYTNLKIFNFKFDTLLNSNGFDSQAVSSTVLALRTAPVLSDVLQVIGMHGFRIEDAAAADCCDSLVAGSSCGGGGGGGRRSQSTKRKLSRIVAGLRGGDGGGDDDDDDGVVAPKKK